MADNDRFEYDVALSFAPEDRTEAEEFASLLRARNRNVLYDEYEPSEPGTNHLIVHLGELFRTKAWCCVLCISKHYPLKRWTDEERRAIEEHSLRDASNCIFLLKLDDTEVPGINETSGFNDLRRESKAHIVSLLEQALKETRHRSGSPSRSHDLRSGHMPSTPSKD